MLFFQQKGLKDESFKADCIFNNVPYCCILYLSVELVSTAVCENMNGEMQPFCRRNRAAATAAAAGRRVCGLRMTDLDDSSFD